MDYTPQELMEQLKNNRGALEGLLRSPDGARLIQMMSQRDGGAALQRAAGAAAKGDTGEMARMVQQVMQSPEGAELAERIRRSINL